MARPEETVRPGCRAERFADEMRAARTPLVVLSPHLDDAVLSCGALLAHLAPRCPVTVVTVFTTATPRPWPLPARRQMRAIGEADAEAFYARRRAEDLAVLGDAGAAAVHLGLPDALFRRAGGAPGTAGRPAYPTFRFDAARGRVSGADAWLPAAIAERAAGIARAAGAGVILAPLGIGRHVDHLITRSAARLLRPGVLYYSDFPYSQRAAPEQGFVRRGVLAPHRWLRGRAENAARIAGYRTQFAGLFPGGAVPLRPEVYWFPASDSAISA